MGKNVVEELLISLGLENDAKSFQEGTRLFDGIRAKALLFGGAIAGLAYGSQKMVMNFADAKDQLGKFQDATGVSARFVDSLGHALDKSGGKAADAFGSVENMVNLMEKIKWGEIGDMKNALSSGIDFSALGASRSIEEAYLLLSEMIRRIPESQQKQRLAVANELGFGQSDLNMLQKGPEEIRRLLAEAQRLSPVTDEMLNNAADVNDAAAELSRAITGITDELANKMAPRFAEFSRQMADFLAENRGLVGETYDNFISDTSAEIEGFAKWLDALSNGDVNKVFEQTEGAIRYLFTGDSKPAPAPEGFWDYSADDTLGALPPPAATANRETNTEYNITVDARGSSNPAAVANQVEAAVMKALGRAAERSVEITEGPLR